jgi:ATP-dependent helicase/nuclease subunit A
MATLTKSQLLAKNHLVGDVLIAAGAGSGKTKVLTERVIKLVLEDEIPLQRLLLLTFTNAAAAEMKQRIRKAFLTAKRDDLASEIDQSFIMTFDAYALYLLQKHGHVYHLSPQVGVYEETLYEIERKQTLEDIFQERYQQPTPDFISLIQAYVINQDESLKAFILKIDRQADLLEDKLGYYRRYVGDFFETQWKKEKVNELDQYYRKEIGLIQKLATEFESSEQTSFFYELTNQWLAQPTLNDLLKTIQLVSFPRLKPKSISEEDKQLRDRLKVDILALKADAAMVPIENQVVYYQATQPYVEAILTILLELNQRLEIKKRQLQRYPFADIAKLAKQLLDVPSIYEGIRHQFSFIMVDEYQDTNDLQDAFLQKISNRNLFMVGDVKQSIYRFRNANVKLFKQKFNQFKDYQLSEDKHQTKIILQENFRSRPEVLSDINAIFSHLMSETTGGLHYDHHQRLQPSQTLYESNKDERVDYKMDILRYEKSDSNSQLNEPRIIAKDIIDKINQKILVADLDEKKQRPITFKDFTILIDRKTNFESFIEVFNEAGIPLEVFAERDLSNSDMFRVLKNLIILVNRFQDGQILDDNKHAYVSVLRSFLYQTSDEDLYLFATGKKPMTNFSLFTNLKDWVQLSKTLTLNQWMQRVVHDLHLEEKLLTLPDLPANIARLEGWMHKARQLSELGYTVESFGKFLLESESLEVELTIASPKQSENAVQLMTIHKSKGLEFAYVYYPGLTKGFNMMDTKGLYQYSTTYGIQLPYPEAVYVRPIFADLILQEEKQAIISEQVRLWYVALTRAKEKIILVLESSDTKKLVDVEKSRTFADFMYLYHQSVSVGQDQGTRVDPLVAMPSLHEPPQPKEPKPLRFDQVSQTFDVVLPKRASKSMDGESDETSLAYGTYLHECMFLLDFKTLDTSFIASKHDRHMIDLLLTQPYFVALSKKEQQGQVTILKEYAYLDAVTGQRGIIDLLIIEGGTATILDYKTTNIDDPAYPKQLAAYQRYVQSRGMVVTAMYLISLTTNQMKQVPLMSDQTD